MGNFRRAVIGISRIFNRTTAPCPILNRTPAPCPILNSKITPEFLHRPCVVLLSRYYSANQSLDVDLSNEESKRRLINRLVYRSRQRGFLELDLVLGKWVEEHIPSMDEKGIKSLVDVLDLENPDLWKWLTGQEQPPEALSTNPVFTALHEKVTGNLNSHTAPETRATPGQPWVRGWDDFKKGKDSPVVGNQ